MHEDSLFSTSHQHFISLFRNCHSGKCEVISCWFLFAFLIWLMILSIFSCGCCPSGCLCWESIHTEPFPIISYYFFLFLFCIISLSSLDIKPLSYIWFANIFSHSVGCLFTLLTVPFANWKLFPWIWIFFFFFASVAMLFNVIPKKISSRPELRSFFPTFYSRSSTGVLNGFSSSLKSILSCFLWMM